MQSHIPKPAASADGLTADEFHAAVVEWAQREVSSATDVRFDAAKFLFSVSTATLGFIATVWKVFHHDQVIAAPLVFSMAYLCGAVVFSLYMFWPVFYQFSSKTNIEAEHNELVSRFIYEGIIWAVLWGLGVSIGLWAILH